MLKAFASFGFCKAHAAAFALPTYQSAWLKAHHPAAFLAGVLTHDPGMYPKRLILDDARQFGIAVLSLDVNASQPSYTVERVGFLDEPPPAILGAPRAAGPPTCGCPTAGATASGSGWPTCGASTRPRSRGSSRAGPTPPCRDFWHRAQVSRPVVERLVVAGAFDSLYGLGSTRPRSAARAGHPPRPAAAGRRARPLEPVGEPVSRQGAPEGPKGHPRQGLRPGRRRRAAGPAVAEGRPRSSRSTPSWPSTSATPPSTP